MLVPLIASHVHSGSEQFAQLFPEAGVWKPSSHLMKAISMKDFRSWFASEWAGAITEGIWASMCPEVGFKPRRRDSSDCALLVLCYGLPRTSEDS